jgi:DNA-binding MarR family transcriptional regulator
MNSTDIAFLFGEVARLTRRRFNQQMESFRLTHAQSRTLLRLSRCQGLRQVDLAKILEIQPITLVKRNFSLSCGDGILLPLVDQFS